MASKIDVEGMFRGVARSFTKGKASVSIETIEEALAPAKPSVASVTVDGNFTTVALFDAYSGKIFVGTAKRHPKDASKPVRGAHLATSRALRNLMDSYLGPIVK